jgi:IS605 OrfB family transposase
MAENAIRHASSKYLIRKSRTRNDPIEFKQLFLPLNYPREYGITDDATISLITLKGRKKFAYQCGHYQREILQLTDRTIKSAILCYRKRDHVILLNIAVEKDIPDVELTERDGKVGVDLGIYNIAVTSENTFFNGQHIHTIRHRYQLMRQSCQSKDTRSAKRKLRKISGRERRFVTDTNHCIAKQIVAESLSKYTKPIIVLEDLKGIRLNSYKRRKNQRRELNNWSFYQLQQFIAYKAVEKAVPVIWVNPKYTSQTCPKCGCRDKQNRHQQVHSFTCIKCGYTTNDDRIGALNIRARGTDLRYMRRSLGVCQAP